MFVSVSVRVAHVCICVHVCCVCGCVRAYFKPVQNTGDKLEGYVHFRIECLVGNHNLISVNEWVDE